MNKGEKRALKFALQKGLDMEKVEDLKEFLQSQMVEKARKLTVKAAKGAEQEQSNNPHRLKHSDYRMLDQ